MKSYNLKMDLQLFADPSASLPKADTPLTEGVTPNGQTLNVTTITSDLHQYGGWTPLTDVLQMTAIDNNVVQDRKSVV